MLIAQDIESQIQDLLVVNHVATQFQLGFVYGIVGHNCSGKSTFIKLLAEQIAATSCVITLDEKNRF
ncbi:ATP-binding cassette domain-containing protein [Gilliamella apicola]|uniref:ATP-binding cassette domain-containing protein n=1 Tax=Gilliamella apicola TaxID=1196095 RepID=A0A556RL37_9GAMM|nr:ATP-binding cassette domain-containing protein [Gilliamella apicola]TSJ89535.1 ATP-binding cassette domain-containing protein [Gilliamella apicola]